MKEREYEDPRVDESILEVEDEQEQLTEEMSLNEGE